MRKYSIIGSGSFGTAIAQILTDNNCEVMMYTRNRCQRDEININKTNIQFFDNLVFDSGVSATDNISEAVNYSDNIIIALPSGEIREVLKTINLYINKPKLFISVSKGIEPHTNKMISDIIEEEIDSSKRGGLVILSGPSFAEELVLRHYTGMLSVSNNEEVAIKVQKAFSNEYLRLYTSTDLIGVQIAGTVKNILAIASGVVYGMGYGDNTRALLLTRGLHEMYRYGIAKGGRPETFYGLAGVGDLILTAGSFHSRNFQTGLKIGQEMDVKDAVTSSKTVVEGVRAALAIYLDAHNLNIDMPITKEVYNLFYNNKDPKLAIGDLINRELKPEKQIEMVLKKKTNTKL